MTDTSNPTEALAGAMEVHRDLADKLRAAQASLADAAEIERRLRTDAEDAAAGGDGEEARQAWLTARARLDVLRLEAAGLTRAVNRAADGLRGALRDAQASLQAGVVDAVAAADRRFRSFVGRALAEHRAAVALTDLTPDHHLGDVVRSVRLPAGLLSDARHEIGRLQGQALPVLAQGDEHLRELADAITAAERAVRTAPMMEAA